MAAGLPTIPSQLPVPSPAPPATDCLECAQLRSLLLQCGNCGKPPPTPGSCPPSDVPFASNGTCPSGYTPDPSSPGCCTPSLPGPGPQPNLCNIPGDVARPANGICPQGYAPDPASPLCCEPSVKQQDGCPNGEVLAPCPPGYSPDPNSPGCCVSTNQPPCVGSLCHVAVCPAGETPAPCAAGTVPDPGNQGCCTPAVTGCPQADITKPPAGCPSGYLPDPNFPNCCTPSATLCAPPRQPPPCPQGYGPDQGGCCAPLPVETCFVCPGGLPELAAALQGGQNNCYLASQMFFPSATGLPAPVQ
jgi:hypothetical protein